MHVKLWVKGVFIFSSWVSCFFSVGLVDLYAQELFRWKDERGAVHVSDKPPPVACMSDSCRAYRDGVDEKLRKERAAKEEKEAMEEKKRRDFIEWKKKNNERDKILNAKFYAKAKKELQRCMRPEVTCVYQKINTELDHIASRGGQDGVLEVLGQPERKQVLSSDGVRVNSYWYYRFGNNMIQLEWEETGLREAEGWKRVELLKMVRMY